MSELGYAPIQIPSRGLLSDGKIPDGRVQIRKLTVGEEMILQSTTGGSALVSALIQACVKLPPGVTHSDLLSNDRLAILVALRVYTFGRMYPYTFKCQHCGAPNKAECDVGSDIKEKVSPPGLVEPVDVRLDDADVTVSLRFLRGRDEEQVAKASKRTIDYSTVTRMALNLVKINGQEPGDMAAREKFVLGLTMVDGDKFRRALDDVEPGMDLSLTPDCQTCGMSNLLTLPFSLDFFRPTRH